MFEQWHSFCLKSGLPVLDICLCKLREYFDLLQVTYVYAYTNLCIHACGIYSILQPTEQIRPLMAPLVKQLLKDVFRKNPPARVCADTWDVKKVLDQLHAWGNPLAFNI